jgi:hypothetical protein
MTRRISSANLGAKARNKARNKGKKCPGRTAVQKGRVVFGAIPPHTAVIAAKIKRAAQFREILDMAA